ncbi:hypothetical protein AAF712_002260 [Marasmius tenuissimus]|uniref:Lysine-specific metallo-endopeptidase domain-containing protein n=1 Tax=Marasmius tenuissimus TaxID=585030 RepID=A0ABR3AAR5_9AGAR
MQFSWAIHYPAVAALCLFATSVAGKSALSLSVSAPRLGARNLDGVENSKVITSLVNTGDSSLKLLRDPRTIISSLPTDSFTITDISGASPTFIGAFAKFVPDYVVRNNIEEAFIILNPGEIFEVKHDLSMAYNFTSSGEGVYDIRAKNLFMYVEPTTNEIGQLEAIHEAPLTTSIAGNLAYVAHVPRHNKRVQYASCSSSQQSQLVSAASAAIDYANSAYDYLNSHNSSTSRYASWFGTYDATRHDTVLSHFNNIKGFPFADSATYNCSCTEPGTFAFVNRATFGVINLCGAFWSAPLTGTDSMGGTLVHESSHFTQIANTYDIVYGQGGCRAFALNDPGVVVGNADSHEYFAENNPAEA